MKLELKCPSCLGVPGLFRVPIRDDGYYKVKCPNDHEHIYCVPMGLYEVLYDLALNAVVDEYPREAVTSFVGSLERFHEFFVKVVRMAAGVPDEAFEQGWKLVAKQSERQLGAYVFAHFALPRRHPPI
jgi:hypothetical protein